MPFAVRSLWLLALGAMGHEPPWHHGPTEPQKLLLTDLGGSGHMHFCFDEPIQQTGCTTTETSSATASTETASSSSTTVTSRTDSTESTSTSTDTTCFKYPDCYLTCHELVAPENGFDPCVDTFCSTCPFAHMCDTSCGVCSYNTTESETSSASTMSETTLSFTTESDTSVSQTTTSPTTISATTVSETSSTTASTFSECYQENVGNSMFGASFCESACGGLSPSDCDLNSCETVFCPNCDSTFAGLCDLECGYCTTLTFTSTKSGTSETSTLTSGSSVTTTRTTTTTATTTTESSTSVTTATSTSKSTRTATTRSATSTSETSMTSTGSTSATSTTCFKYADCIDSCETLVGLDPDKCETMFCATCVAAHVCDFTCGICAENTTSSATSSSTRTSDTASTTSVSTETMSTTSISTTSISTTTGSSTFTESTISTFSECTMINLKSDDFCNLTCAGQQCVLDACDTLFCPNCPGLHAGMCDRTCGYCTTLTHTSSVTHTSVTSTRTTSTTETTTTESSTSVSTDTATTTTVSSTITETLSTYTRTSKSTYTTPTQTSTLTTTDSGTTTTCFKLDDCLQNDICGIMIPDCERTFCPSCPAAHLCDTSCGFCYVNSTTTESTTITTDSPTTSTTSTDTGVTATTLSGTSTTSVTTSSRTASTVTDTTETACNQTNLATDAFCEGTCGSEVCPVNICRTLFCLSCDLAGFCDRTCNFCSAKLTSTETSTTSVSSVTLTTSSVSSTATCKPCVIDFPIPHTGCDGLIPCGETCIANTLATPCLEPMTFNFECPDPDDFEKGDAFSLGLDWANGSFMRAHGARSGENHFMCPDEFPSCQTSGIMKGQCVTEECSQNRDLPFRACLDQEPGWPTSRDDVGEDGPFSYVPNGAFWQENDNFINTRTSTGDGPGSPCTSDFEFFRAARLIDTLGYFTINCQSCAFGTHELTDTDLRGNHINVTLEFGPNVLDGVVNEGILSGYAVYLVSACTVPTKYKEGWTHYIKVAEVPVDPSEDSETAAECRCGEGRNKYSVTVAREIDHFNGEMTYYYDDVSLSLRFDYFDFYIATYLGQYLEQYDRYLYYFMYYESYATLYDDHELEWRLMVVPVLLDGTEMPVGLTTETIRDVSEASHTIELDWCFSIPVDQAVCASTSSVTTSSATSTVSTESVTTSSATTGTETSTGTTQSTCFMYQDCYQTCALMRAADPSVCEWQFCEVCSHAHFCDTSCGICASNITTSDTSTGTSSSDTSSTTYTSSTTVSTSSETSSTTQSTGTTSGTSSTTLSTETVCYMEDLMNSSICMQSCDGVHCQVDVCNTLYCPNCPGPYAGLCDKTCRFCTTVTVSSYTTGSTDTSTQTTKSRTTTTTVSTTTGTSTVSTFSSTTETSTFTTTASTTSETTYTSTGSSTTTASTDSETSTGCFLYEDCLETCEHMVAGLVTVSGFLSGSAFACHNGLCTCDTIFCPTCSGAHLCDTTCGWCAYNTTTSESSTTSASTTSETSMSTTSMSTTSGTQSTVTFTGTSMSVSTSTTSTSSVTPCASVNILSEEFCNATCIQGDRCANDGCAALFCPNCPGAYAGMCDRTCGFCTTLTNTSTTSLTSTTFTRTTSTTETTVTDTATSDTTDTTTITTWSGSTTGTISSSTSVTTDTGSSTTATSSTTLSTGTETSVCYMFDDCLTTCEEMRDNCAITFCPTCPGAHLCDTTCSICAFNVSHPCLCTTSTDSSSTTASTDTDTTSSATTASDTSVSTTSGSSTTSMSTTSQTSSTTFTPCNPINFANDTFCDISCGSTDCPRDVCESLFCPTCHFAGHCDRSCNFCTAKHTTSRTSTTTLTSVSTVSETTDSTYTCEPCHVNFEVPGLGIAASGCNGPLACDSTCFVVLGFHESYCFSGMQLEFTCPPGNDFEIPYAIDHVKIPLREGLPIARRLGERQHLDERVQDRRLQLLNPEPRTWGNGTVLRIDQHVEHVGGRSPWISAFLAGDGLIDVDHFNIYCASCGFGASGLANDTDINCGELSTTLLFGPNVFDGMVNESMLSGYAVFIVEDCQESLLEHTHIDNAIAIVPATGVGSGTMTGEQCACSMKEQYSVPLNISFVGQHTNLMVVPILNDATVVPVGPTIKVEDLCISTTTETSTTTDTLVELASGVLALSALSPGTDLVGMMSQLQLLLADHHGVTEQDVGVVISNSQDFVELASSQAGGDGTAENQSVYICIEVAAQSHTEHLRPINDNQLLNLWIQVLRDTHSDATVVTTLHTSKVDRATYSSLSQCVKELKFIEQARTSTSTTLVSETTVTGTVTSFSTTATSATSKTTTSNTRTSATSTHTSTTKTSTTTTSKTTASRTVTSMTTTSMTTTSMTTASKTVTSETTTSRTVTSETTTSRTATTGTTGTKTTRSTSITTTSPHTATTRTTITDIYASRTATSTTTATTDTTFTSVTTISTTASSASASSTTASFTTASSTVSSFTTVTSTTATSTSATSNSATSTSATSVSATSVSPTSTSVTGTVTSVTTVSRTAMSSVRGNVVVSLEGASEDLVIASAKTAVAAVYGVSESLVRVTIAGGRRLSGRSLQSAWNLDYEILANAQALATKLETFDSDAAAATFTNAMASTLGIGASEVTVSSFSNPVTEAVVNENEAGDDAEEDENEGMTSGGEPAASNTKASSGTVVFILGIVVFVVLFVGLLIPCLCKRRLRNLCSRKGNMVQNNATPKAQPDSGQPDRSKVEKKAVGWDVDLKQAPAETVDRGASQSALEAIAALGLTVEESRQMGLVKGITV